MKSKRKNAEEALFIHKVIIFSYFTLNKFENNLNMDLYLEIV